MSDGERVPPEIWDLLELVLVNAAAGTLDPTEIAAPKRRTDVSNALDYIERQLYADAIPTDAVAAADLRRQWSSLRLVRFFARDDADQLRATVGQLLGARRSDADPVTWRLHAILDVLRPTGEPNADKRPTAH